MAAMNSPTFACSTKQELWCSVSPKPIALQCVIQRRRSWRAPEGYSFCPGSLKAQLKQSESAKRFKKTSKGLNSEVSPHRAVSAVRLLRIELGGAFADLMNVEGQNALDNEMDYVERSLGFRTKPLDARARRLNVKLAKATLRTGAGNMVNGILRSITSLKEKNMLPLPKVEGDDRSQARALAIIYSHPVWMIRRWTKCFGQPTTIQLMEWNNKPPIYSLRANSGRSVSRNDLVLLLKKFKVPYELSPHMADFVRVATGLQSVIQAGLLRQGICVVQDESAGLVVSIVDPRPGETIIDCCAAPGGKALFMASRLRGQGSIIAVDVNEGRLQMLGKAAKVQGVDSVVTTYHNDIRNFIVEATIQADKVLLDVPCSGLGVLSKRADMRWNRTLKDLEQLTTLQDSLLDAASLLVKPGGILVYSTCSIDLAENKERIETFLQRHRGFTVEAVNKFVPKEFISDEGFYVSHPCIHSLDGAFAARLYRVVN